ncbi:PhoH family protein [Dietzia timorensis]|uniref:PhoH-like protein n=1 Tax=Dietzia timorensis TaxID=499555 RepID=A0A173LKK7_9ACTN|nr:PhoH family protein [Dietzia timorensis]ANI92038.1 PhoH-like protein [Dietzia timorensis]
MLEPDVAFAVLGTADANLRALEDALDADVHVRGGQVTLTGARDDVSHAADVVNDLRRQAKRGVAITPDSVLRSVDLTKDTAAPAAADVMSAEILRRRGKTIRPKTLGQKEYVDAIDSHTIVFGLGPAGTGKTYLAIAKAVAALSAKEIDRIILTRPAVEAGERLGFLPGALSDKIDPYMRPLYDALHDMMDPEAIPKLMAAGVIEVAPLAYMRGRTLNDAFIILDEAQNTTPEQMKMFLTRLGFGSKIVVTGDGSQVDLPGGQKSGLRVVQRILDGVDDIHFSTLTSKDVVRHSLVSRIVEAYDAFDKRSARGDDEDGANRAERRHPGQGRAGRGPGTRTERERQRQHGKGRN